MTVRAYCPADLDAALDLFFELFEAQHRGHPTLFRLPRRSDPDERERLAEVVTALSSQEDAALLTAHLGGSVVGLVHVAVRDVPPAASLPFRHGARQGWIHHIVVSAAARRTGVGSALDAAARSWASDRGASSIGLQVWAYNQSAAGFFRALGYDARTHRLFADLGNGGDRAG